MECVEAHHGLDLQGTAASLQINDFNDFVVDCIALYWA